MSTQQKATLEPIKFGWSSAPIRIVIGVVAAALIPLVLMLGFTWFFTRPALIDSSTSALKVDAQNRQQLIDNYINERVGDAKTLAQIQSTLEYYVAYDTAALQGQSLPASNPDVLHAQITLQAGELKDSNYVRWVYFDPAGKVMLSYPSAPGSHGSSIVPADDLQKVTQGQVVVSPVYASTDHTTATVDIYVPIVLAPPTVPSQKFLGFARSTLKLDYIWNSVVQKDAGANGSGSYSFILDNNGVRIADTDPSHRFQGVETINSDTEQQIEQEQRYGTQNATTIAADTNLANSLNNNKTTDSFQEQPVGANQSYQVIRQSSSNQYIQWNYFTLSPISTVTAVATNELINITGLALVDSLILALIAFFAWRSFARPVLTSVENLRKGSLSLNSLAAQQRDASSEQMWVVDSSQGGLQSVQYYTDAFKVAVHELHEAANGLTQTWQQGGNSQQMQQALERIMSATNYLENAAQYQNVSNQKLATALNVATLATDQLHDGATSAADAAAQLDQVINRLLALIGKQQQ